MFKKEEILRVLALPLRQCLTAGDQAWDAVEEIRLGIRRPMTVRMHGRTCFLNEGGRCDSAAQGHVVTERELRETMNYLSEYSRYAFEEQIRQGFLTIRGGHRVGLCGRVVTEQGRVKTIAPVTGIHIRIARQCPGCADKIFPLLFEKDQLQHTLVVSPPGWGKTTLLRELIRRLSCSGYTVGVVDERSELAACYQGVPQNDLGPCTDVLDGCPKAEGIKMLVRAMAPQVIAVDEIGGDEDLLAVKQAMSSGCKVITSAHRWTGIKEQQMIHQSRETGFGRIVEIHREGEGRRYRVYDNVKGMWVPEENV